MEEDANRCDIFIALWQYRNVSTVCLLNVEVKQIYQG